MAGDDYTATVGGGLKLKGGKPTGIKKKKKSKVIATQADTCSDEQAEASATAGNDLSDGAVSEGKVSKLGDGQSEPDAGKTATEKKHEEMKRKRLNERLLKTGSKTHKERVEELNKYLSKLSEHHDMPKIGPG